MKNIKTVLFFFVRMFARARDNPNKVNVLIVFIL